MTVSAPPASDSSRRWEMEQFKRAAQKMGVDAEAGWMKCTIGQAMDAGALYDVMSMSEESVVFDSEEIAEQTRS